MYAEPRDPRSFSLVFEAVSQFVPEGTLVFDEKLSFKGMDPSLVVMVSFEMSPSSFLRYESSGERVPVNLEELARILSRAREGISLETLEGYLVVKLREKGVLREFQLPLLDIREQEPPVPSLEGQEVSVPTDPLRRSIKDASMFSTSVLLHLKPGKLVVEASGTSGNFRSEITCNYSGEEVYSQYSVDFLSAILKYAQSPTLSLTLSSDAPLRIMYKIGDTPMNYYLAHIIL